MRTRAGTRAAAIGVLVALACTAGACSDGGGDNAPDTAAATGDVLATLADEVIIPSYEALVASIETLGDDVDALCAAPSSDALNAAGDAWRDASTAWRASRAVGVGPATDRRLASSLGFMPRSDAVSDLLAGDDPVDLASIEGAGVSVKGIAALEVGLFGPGSDDLATGDPRRCEYLASATALAVSAAQEVLEDWTGGYRDTFVDGMDGDPQSSVDAIVNEVINRVTQLDDQGLRDVAAASSPDDVPASRRDGPAEFRLAELRATLTGAAAVLGDDAADGRLLRLMASRSDDTATRLRDATREATDAMEALPDSVAAGFDDPGELGAAQEAVAALKVLLATEVASELGVTISFSDSDGDS